MKAAGALLVLGLVLTVWWFVSEREDLESSGDSQAVAEDSGESGPSSETQTPEVRLIERNLFIENYGKEGGSVSSDLKALQAIVRDCQLLFKDFDRNHLPGNPEITRFLQGGNPDRLAWIPPGHRLVNEEGELLDRFGEPVFFHRLSGMLFEYRSAGPDRRHWTSDDVVVK